MFDTQGILYHQWDIVKKNIIRKADKISFWLILKYMGKSRNGTSQGVEIRMVR